MTAAVVHLGRLLLLWRRPHRGQGQIQGVRRLARLRPARPRAAVGRQELGLDAAPDDRLLLVDPCAPCRCRVGTEKSHSISHCSQTGGQPLPTGVLFGPFQNPCCDIEASCAAWVVLGIHGRRLSSDLAVSRARWRRRPACSWSPSCAGCWASRCCRPPTRRRSPRRCWPQQRRRRSCLLCTGQTRGCAMQDYTQWPATAKRVHRMLLSTSWRLTAAVLQQTADVSVVGLIMRDTCGLRCRRRPRLAAKRPLTAATSPGGRIRQCVGISCRSMAQSATQWRAQCDV